jgi:hypothetical protein
MLVKGMMKTHSYDELATNDQLHDNPDTQDVLPATNVHAPSDSNFSKTLKFDAPTTKYVLPDSSLISHCLQPSAKPGGPLTTRSGKPYQKFSIFALCLSYIVGKNRKNAGQTFEQ